MSHTKRILSVFLLTQILLGCTKTTLKEDTNPGNVGSNDLNKIEKEEKGSVTAFLEKTIDGDTDLISKSIISAPAKAEIRGLKSKFENIKIPETIKPESPVPLIVKNPFTGSFIWPYSSFRLLFDNDIFNNTDRYYTNGVHLIYNSPALAFFRINRIFPAINKQSVEFNSIELNHAIYTPFTTKKPPTLINDRPYASILYLTFLRRTEKLSGKMSIESSLDVGVIGEIALGSILQQGVHSSLITNDFPLGWETQIKNDLLLNYNMRLRKRIFSFASINSSFITQLEVGSRLTGATTGIILATGSQMFHKTSEKKAPGSVTDKNRPFKYSIETSILANVVGYNATLNGGLFNKNNTFVLNFEQIEKFNLKCYLKLSVCYKMVGISLTQFYSTPEFKNGQDHFWGQVGIQIGY